MKYELETIHIILDELQKGSGRTRAAQNANISYQCFLNWCGDKTKIITPALIKGKDSEAIESMLMVDGKLLKKIEFFEAVKKSELTGNDRIKGLCQRRILDDKSWQSAAWWLERNYPDEYKNRQDFSHSVKDGDLSAAEQVVKNMKDKGIELD
jgi:pentatricopeptide repeat protein